MISRPKVVRLITKANIRSKIKQKFIVTKDSNHTHLAAENLIDRQFKVLGTISMWGFDLTYIQTLSGCKSNSNTDKPH